MSTPPSGHNVARQNYVDPAILPVRRKRGRPRKDEAVSELTLRSQQQRANSTASSSRGLVGQAVSGILDGTFDAGYLLTVRVGTTGPVFKGVLFDPRLSPPITAENDIAPHLPMISQNDFIVAEPSSQASEMTPGKPVHQNVRAVQPILRPDVVAVPTSGQPVHQNVRAVQPILRSDVVVVPTSGQPVQQNVRAVQLTQRNEPAAAPTPAQPAQQNVKDFLPIHKNEPAAAPTPAQPGQQNVKDFLKDFLPIHKNEPAAAPTPAQPAQVNVKDFHPIPKNESAAVHAPVHFRAVQSFEGNKSTTIPAPALLVQQNAVAIRSLQKSEPTAVPSPTLSVQQNLQSIEPDQRNEPSVVHTLAHHAEHNVKTVQPLLGDDSASVFRQTEDILSIPEVTPGILSQSNQTDSASVFRQTEDILSIPEVTPGILSQSNQTASSLYAEQVVLNDSGCVLHSDSTPKDSQVCGQVESSSNPSISAIHQPLEYEVKNGQSAALEGLLSTVVKEEDAQVIIPSSDDQSGGMEAPKETDAVPQQLGGSLCSTNWTQQSVEILNADENVSGIPDFTSQMPQPETLVVECKSELQDVWIGQFGASTPSALQDSIYDPELMQVDGLTALEFSKPPPPPGDDSV